MSSRRGSSVSEKIVRFVRYGTVSRPSIGGTAGSLPVAITKASAAIASPSTSTADGELKRAWNVRRTPTFFLMDKKGNLRYCYEGFLEYQKLHNERVMRDKIEELLKEEVAK